MDSVVRCKDDESVRAFAAALAAVDMIAGRIALAEFATRQEARVDRLLGTVGSEPEPSVDVLAAIVRPLAMIQQHLRGEPVTVGADARARTRRFSKVAVSAAGAAAWLNGRLFARGRTGGALEAPAAMDPAIGSQFGQDSQEDVCDL